MIEEKKVKTVYDYLPFNVDKMNELSGGVKFDYPREGLSYHECIDAMLETAFVMGYIKGSSDETDNFNNMLNSNNPELFKKVVVEQLKHSFNDRYNRTEENLDK